MNQKQLLYPVRIALHMLLLLFVIVTLVGTGGCSKEEVSNPTTTLQTRYLYVFLAVAK